MTYLIPCANVPSTCLSSASLPLPGPRLPQELPWPEQEENAAESWGRVQQRAGPLWPKGPEGCDLVELEQGS